VYTIQEIERELVGPFVDFITALAILYLFYSLGIKKVRAEGSQRNLIKTLNG
jgi:hypothetical protein